MSNKRGWICMNILEAVLWRRGIYLVSFGRLRGWVFVGLGRRGGRPHRNRNTPI